MHSAAKRHMIQSRYGYRRSRVSTHGYSLIEVLVVIGILGTLLAIVLPAVQSARESSRLAQCGSHLHQLAVAFANHESAHKHLPTGGWGWGWAGDPDRGYGARQPGGWGYNVLPFIEEREVREIGRRSIPSKRPTELTRAIARVIPLYYCPSRRPATALPLGPNTTLRNAYALVSVGRLDYAANCGDQPFSELETPGPTSLEEGDSRFQWPRKLSEATGICFGRSTIRFRDLIDGASQTYLVGEKHVNQSMYATGLDWGDNEFALVGFDNDICRTAHPSARPVSDATELVGSAMGLPYGSAHRGVFQMAMCDGAVIGVTFDVDAEVHRARGNRADRRKK